MMAPCAAASCAAEGTHKLYASEVVFVLAAYGRGELHTTRRNGQIVPLCIMRAVPRKGRS